MKRALKIGKVFNTKIEIHWTFLLLLAYVAWSTYNAGGNFDEIVLQIAFVLSIFVCVILHELGHVRAAFHFGIPTKKVTLLPIGGVAQIERMPEKPKEEFIVAIAGPLVNVAIALILFIVFPITEMYNAAYTASSVSISYATFPLYLFSANIVLFLFNLIPAFPMDGGRILRSLLALKMSRMKATKIASITGQFIAVIFFILGLMNNPFLALIAVFIFFGARSENYAVQSEELLSGYEVQDAMMTNYLVLSPNETIDSAIRKMVSGPDIDLLVIEDNNVQGIVTREKLISKSKERNSHEILVKDIMTRNFKVLEEHNKLSDTYLMLQRTKNRLFPVLRNKELAGVINLEKIQNFIMMKAKGFQY